MELNKDVEVFVLEDWIGRGLGKFNTLDELEEEISNLEENDEQVLEAKSYLKMVDEWLNNQEIIESAELAIEELKTMVREELYAYGLDKNNNRIDIQFG